MAAFIAKQMVGNQLSAVKGKLKLKLYLVLRIIECVRVKMSKWCKTCEIMESNFIRVPDAPIVCKEEKKI